MFRYLNRTAQSIAQTFGPSCETLIHDMSKPGHPIVAIYNGHVSGRHTGDTSDIFGGNRYASGDTTHFKPEADMVNTLVIRENGHRIKSTTVNYIGDNFHYALGINFDCTELMSAMNALETLIGSAFAGRKAACPRCAFGIAYPASCWEPSLRQRLCGNGQHAVFPWHAHNA